MRLMYFPVNAAWAFVFGKDLRTATPITLTGFQRFFQKKYQAIQAARSLGLAVDARGNVTTLEKNPQDKIPGLAGWNYYAGGTGAKPGTHSYDIRGDFGEYHIWPPTHSKVRYSLQWADTKGLLGGGLWHEIKGFFQHPAEAVKAARIHAQGLPTKNPLKNIRRIPQGVKQYAVALLGVHGGDLKETIKHVDETIVSGIKGRTLKAWVMLRHYLFSLAKKKKAHKNPAYDPWKSLTIYDVHVGNIGQVYHGIHRDKALAHFKEYVDQSKRGYGRAAGESVTLMAGGEIIKEHVGTVENPCHRRARALTIAHAKLLNPEERPYHALKNLKVGETITVIPHFTIKRSRKDSYWLFDDRVRERARVGTLNQIVTDLNHVFDYGTLPEAGKRMF